MGQGNNKRKAYLGTNNNTASKAILGALDAITDNIFDFDQQGRGEYIDTQIEKSQEIKALMDDNNISRQDALDIIKNSGNSDVVKETVFDNGNITKNTTVTNATNKNESQFNFNDILDKYFKPNLSSLDNLISKKGADKKLPRDLRYPYSSIDSTQDFLKFSIFEYKRQQFLTRNQKQLKADLLGNILLPIPGQLVDSNATNFGGGDSMDFFSGTGLQAIDTLFGDKPEQALDTIRDAGFKAGGDIKKLLSTFITTKAINILPGMSADFSNVLTRNSGQVLNPNMELLFNGPILRQFNYQFKLTPRFKEEAQVVRTIIKAFKRNMAPKGENGIFLKTPNIFEIQYVGKAKDYLNRMKLCALTGVGVNYTGDGNWATYQDGSPISMLLTLSFKEVMPIYNEDYAGYDDDSDGVGY